ncbi:hypothetical protein [Pseudonocardia sp. ICBG601]|uniref:hypothetical protein n=1 Tax=Pseudonocardia sp. ICBG601 TaxID=2846759 RepID=UPI001CF62F36|nr:hypothetical protein [Pseudonocardia sp. ICBG601]
MITVKKNARPWRRIYKFDPLLDVLVIVCVVTVVTQRLLRSVPQLFPGGALLGDVIAALALSFIGAWFFNLLVIRLPKQRDKGAFVEVSGKLVARFATTAVGILQPMATEHGMRPPPRQPDPEYLSELMAKVSPMGPAPMVGFQGQRYNWIQFTDDAIDRAIALKNRLTPFFPQMEAETVASIAAVENCTLFQTIKLQVASGPITNPDMTVFESMYFDLWSACAKVGDRYLVEVAPLLEASQRADLDNLNGATPPPEAEGGRRWLWSARQER